MKRQSSEQRKRERKLSELKRARIRREILEFGFAFCENCGRGYTDEDDAMGCLAGHHKRHRGMGASFNREGIDDEDNIVLLCPPCHRRQH